MSAMHMANQRRRKTSSAEAVEIEAINKRLAEIREESAQLVDRKRRLSDRVRKRKDALQ